ncbi:hypothetical protein JQC91_17820 [Jannaschia sp. Os4]|uniref:hypothetical protein n=1 Tax=Jannaschia sp. Os4 TaxID=2807617 RepID=UPI001939B2A4|nr:hypothetical protein [Jannaschia sp. Os4]MBM2578169.1 hypothetical protein [Jannaschia sp. Os4]
MAEATHTRTASDAEPTPFTISGFERIVSTLRTAVLREERLDTVALDEGSSDVDLGTAQDAAVDAWCAAEAATCAFVRAHREAGPGPLTETATRIVAMLSLTGVDDKAALFRLVTDTMVLRTYVAPTGPEEKLLGDLLPWMYRASVIQSAFLPDDATACDPTGDFAPAA